MKVILVMVTFVSLLTGCSIATDINYNREANARNEEIRSENEKNFLKYGACFIAYDANVSLELLKNRDVKKKIGGGINKYGNYRDGFWIYTHRDLKNNRVEIATMDDIVFSPLKAGVNSMSKSKKLGAMISDAGNLSVGYFYVDKLNCLERENFGTVTLVDAELLK